MVGIGAVTSWLALRELLGVAASQEHAGLPSAALILGLVAGAVVMTLGSALRVFLLGGLAPLGAFGLACLGALVGLADRAGLTPSPASPLVDLLALGLVIAALLLVSPGLRQGRWRVILRRRPASRVETIVVAVALAIVFSGGAALGYQYARGGPPRVLDERPAILDLPAASVLFGASEPQVIAAYFLDLTCASCREEFREITSALREAPLAEGVQLRFYHFPRVEGGCGDAGTGRPKLRVDEGACLGAAAVECVELLAPGLGIRMAGRIFDLQREPEAAIGTSVVAEMAAELGLPIDVQDRQNSLLRCIASNQGVHRRVLAHGAFAETHGVDETPHGFFVGVSEGRLDPARVEAFRGDLSPAIRERKLMSAAGIATVEEFRGVKHGAGSIAAPAEPEGAAGGGKRASPSTSRPSGGPP